MNKIREAATFFCLFYPVAHLWLYWQMIPPVVAKHFSLTGQPDGFGSRSALWVVPVVSILLDVFLLLLAHVPRFFNLPVPPGDPARARWETVGVELVAWVRLEVIATFAYISWSSVQVALGRSRGLSPFFGVISMIAILLTVAVLYMRGSGMTKSQADRG